MKMLLFNQFFVSDKVYLLLSLVFMTYCNCEVSKPPNRFLTHIFNKYGSNGVISFEVSMI